MMSVPLKSGQVVAPGASTPLVVPVRCAGAEVSALVPPDGVAVLAGDEEVGPSATGEVVVLPVAIDRVVTRPSEDHVEAVEAPDDVVASESTDPIRPAVPVRRSFPLVPKMCQRSSTRVIPRRRPWRASRPQARRPRRAQRPTYRSIASYLPPLARVLNLVRPQTALDLRTVAIAPFRRRSSRKRICLRLDGS